MITIESLSFQEQLERFAELFVNMRRSKQEELEYRVYIREDPFRLKALKPVLDSLLVVKNTLIQPQCTEDQNPYRRFLQELFPMEPQIYLMEESIGLWEEFLFDVHLDQQLFFNLPTSAEELPACITTHLLRQWRPRIGPIWTQEVIRTIDEEIDCLDECSARVIRAYHGLGTPKQTFVRIAKQENISVNRIQRIYHNAWKVLQQQTHLGTYISPIGNMLPTHSNTPIEVMKRDPLQRLLISIYSLPLSERAKNVLTCANIRCVGELAQLSESELKRTRNCGVTTIAEYKRVLEELGLSLSFILDPEIKTAFEKVVYG